MVYAIHTESGICQMSDYRYTGNLYSHNGKIK